MKLLFRQKISTETRTYITFIIQGLMNVNIYPNNNSDDSYITNNYILLQTFYDEYIL